MSQVKFHSPWPIAMKEVVVANDRVSLDYLRVDVISDMHVDIVMEKQMPGALVAKIITNDQLTERYQVRHAALELDHC